MAHFKWRYLGPKNLKFPASNGVRFLLKSLFWRDFFQTALNTTYFLLSSYEGRKFLHQKCITFCQCTLYDDKLPFLFFPCSICIWMNWIESKFVNVFNIQEKQDLHITSSYLKLISSLKDFLRQSHWILKK